MSVDRDTTRLVRSWLEEGVTALPDRVLDTVLDQLPATPQRRSWWPAWRSSPVNRLFIVASAAAAVFIAAILAFNLLPRTGGVGTQPTAAPSPSSSPSPSPSPTAAPITGPIVGTWVAAEATCEQQIATIEASGFTAEQIAQGGSDPTCASHGTNQYSLGFLADGTLRVWDKGTITHPATYRLIAGTQTFESKETGTPVCLTYGYTIDGDQLTIEIADYRCTSSGVAPVSDQIALTGIFETSPFTRQP